MRRSETRVSHSVEGSGPPCYPWNGSQGKTAGDCRGSGQTHRPHGRGTLEARAPSPPDSREVRWSQPQVGVLIAPVLRETGVDGASPTPNLSVARLLARTADAGRAAPRPSPALPSPACDGSEGCSSAEEGCSPARERVSRPAETRDRRVQSRLSLHRRRFSWGEENNRGIRICACDRWGGCVCVLCVCTRPLSSYGTEVASVSLMVPARFAVGKPPSVSQPWSPPEARCRR